jgi:hypothetical protein
MLVLDCRPVADLGPCGSFPLTPALSAGKWRGTHLTLTLSRMEPGHGSSALIPLRHLLPQEKGIGERKAQSRSIEIR